MKLPTAWKWARFYAGMTGEKLKYSVQPRPVSSSSIVIAGSGRSGTTWLQTILAALPGTQEIFEPLNPIWSKEVQGLTGWDDTPHFPRAYYLPAGSEHPGWYRFWEGVLTGQVRSPWTDMQRTAFFPKQFVIKLIRANMMLGFISHHFNPQLIFITRHPCPTIVSRLAKGWRANVNFLLDQEQLVADYLRPWRSEIERAASPLEGHAIWWAVENRVAFDDLARCRASGRAPFTVTYESLCLDPKAVLHEMFAWLGEPVPEHVEMQIEQPSWQSRQEVTYHSVSQRLSTWRNELSQEEQDTILKWASRFDLDLYNQEPLPKDLKGFSYVIN